MFPSYDAGYKLVCGGPAPSKIHGEVVTGAILILAPSPTTFPMPSCNLLKSKLVYTEMLHSTHAKLQHHFLHHPWVLHHLLRLLH